MQIDGHEITLSDINVLLDGRPLYLDRDGLSIVTSMSAVVMTLTADQAAALKADDDATRAARKAAPKTGWHGSQASSRVAKERSYDRGMNEGGEGYNPYRHGSAKTYR